MTAYDPDLDPKILRRLSDAAGRMGYEIVDIAGFFDLVEGHARVQERQVNTLAINAKIEAARAGDAGRG